MSLASHRLDLLRQAAFRRAVLRVGAQHGNVKAPLRYPAGLLVLATSYSRTAYRRTTIGAAAFHCRVRNGNGWGHCAIVTRAEKRMRCSALVRDSRIVTSLQRRSPSDSRFNVLTIHVSLFQRTLVLRYLHSGSFFRFSIHVLRFTSAVPTLRLCFIFEII